MKEILFPCLYNSRIPEETRKNRFSQIGLGGVAIGAAIITAGVVANLAVLIILGTLATISATASIYYLNTSRPNLLPNISENEPPPPVLSGAQTQQQPRDMEPIFVLPSAEPNSQLALEPVQPNVEVLPPQQQPRDMEPIFVPLPASPIVSHLESNFPVDTSQTLSNEPVVSAEPNSELALELVQPEPDLSPSPSLQGWSTRKKIVAAAGMFATASLVYYLWQSSFAPEEPTSESSNPIQSIFPINALAKHLWTVSSQTTAAIGAAIYSLFDTPPIPTEPIIAQTTPIQDFLFDTPTVSQTATLLKNDEILPRNQILTFTSYTTDHPARLGLSLKASQNQRAYCERNGYDYHVFEKNLAAPSLPYWSKIAGIRKLLETAKDHQWIVWLDDDALIANPNVQLNDFILEHGGQNPNTHLIVTTDIFGIPSLNTGVLMVRVSDTSRKLFSDLWNMRTERLSSGYTYGDCPNQSCLHEQQAMEKLLERNPDYLASVARIPQRDANGLGMNVFLRTSHYDFARHMFLDYDGDPKNSRFRDGDFIVQCTGLATDGEIYGSNRFRELGEPETTSNLPNAKNLRERCIDLILTKINPPIKLPHPAKQAFVRVGFLTATIFSFFSKQLLPF